MGERVSEERRTEGSGSDRTLRGERGVRGHG